MDDKLKGPKKYSLRAIIITLVLTLIITAIITIPAAVLSTLFINQRQTAKLNKQITDLRNRLMRSEAQNAQNSTSTGSTGTTSSQNQSDWVEYENSRFAFKISYPGDFSAKESTNGDGITLTKDDITIVAFGVKDNSIDIPAYITKNYPKAVNIRNFSNDEADGKSFSEGDAKYYVFKNRLGDYTIISSSDLQGDSAYMLDSIAFTFVPVSE